MDRGQTSEDSLEPRQDNDMEVGNALATRKVLKADREKLRRDKLNEQFLELGNLLDPDRPKNDKGTIVSDTIQVLKELNSEVKRLKKEHALLCEETHELTQEKNEIREEKASLKSSIQQNLRAQQHQQTQGFVVPWDSQLLMAPSYPFPIAVPMHHRAAQVPPLFANATPSTYIPYLAPAMPRVDQPAALNVSASGPRAGTANSTDVATDLELKIPGSKELSARDKSKQRQEKPRNGGD
ncbi:transcription factor bHLH121-like isoform X1 [Salvia miltiorrhiza]|uniref:transcription factor bHLH121-like isoform X1 n=1 Tax=Salvia miltiorrhiza TaxID=226208 RepID=UPI0025AB6031|nr:transcription factor bHLH121-like isoform X1 [Salvia miltiorrhiza]